MRSVQRCDWQRRDWRQAPTPALGNKPGSGGIAPPCLIFRPSAIFRLPPQPAGNCGTLNGKHFPGRSALPRANRRPKGSATRHGGRTRMPRATAEARIPTATLKFLKLQIGRGGHQQQRGADQQCRAKQRENRGDLQAANAIPATWPSSPRNNGKSANPAPRRSRHAGKEIVSVCRFGSAIPGDALNRASPQRHAHRET